MIQNRINGMEVPKMTEEGSCVEPLEKGKLESWVDYDINCKCSGKTKISLHPGHPEMKFCPFCGDKTEE